MEGVRLEWVVGLEVSVGCVISLGTGPETVHSSHKYSSIWARLKEEGVARSIRLQTHT